MSTNELQAQQELSRTLGNRLKTLALHVNNMRRAQRDYFAVRTTENLKVAKQLETQCDAYIKQLQFEKLI